MKELVTIEKGRYQALLEKEKELASNTRRFQELHSKIRDLENRLFTLVVTDKLAKELVTLGDYEKND